MRVRFALMLCAVVGLLALVLPALASAPRAFTPSNFVFLPLVAKPSGANCARTSTGFTPLMDLGTGTFQGYEGGLYAGGSNTPPAAYQQVGITHTQAIQPLDT